MKLSKVQKYAISHLATIGKSNEDISTELNVPTSSVEKYLKSTLAAVPKKEESAPTEPPANFMINHTQSGDKNRGVMIMTQQASMKADSIPKSSTNALKNIFRPKG